MDVNGTKFHLLLGRADWARCAETAERTSYDAQQEALTLRPRLFQFRAAPKDKAVQQSQRRGAARDRFGNWYWLSADQRELLVTSSGSRQTTHFWAACDGVECARLADFGQFQPAAPPLPLVPMDMSALAVTEDHYLVVGVRRPAGLLIFDLHAGGPPRQLLWPEESTKETPFAPLDMAARPGGGVWILARDPSKPDSPVRYWGLDRYFNIVSQEPIVEPASDGQASEFLTLCADGATQSRVRSARSISGGFTLDAASPLTALDAIAIETLPDDTVLILTRDENEAFSHVYRFRFGQQLGDAVSLRAITSVLELDDKQRQSFTLHAHDFAFVAEHQDADGQLVPDRLYVADGLGNQAFAFELLQKGEQLALTPLSDYLPMRLFGGRGLVAAGAQPYYDSVDRWTPLLAQRRPRYETAAELLTEAFDSQTPNCVWHRVLLDACLPPETKVELWSRAAEEPDALTFATWQPEPDFYLRRDGSELPFLNYRASAESLRQGRGTWELCLQQARGRWLQLKIQLSGDGRTTPRLHALRIYYPRFSYLENYLPAVYREDAASASFLERFLANLEGIYTTLEDRIAAAQLLFDWRSAPPAALDWLATWFGLLLEPEWDTARRRLLIHYAMTLFQWRGTIPGLQMALRLALEECADDTIFTDPLQRERPHGIRIIERFRTRGVARAALGDTTEESAADFQSTAHGFSVLLPLPPQYRTNRAEQERRRTLATRVVALEKPAHTTFDVKFYWALWRVGGVRLGLDTVLDQGSRAPQLLPPLVLDQSYLSESWLAPGHPQNVTERLMLGHTQEYKI